MHWRGPGNSGIPSQAPLLFHSDRGSQYASQDFTRLLDQPGITASMSRKGNCGDNACSETLFGSLKVEWLDGQRFATIREAKDAVLAWLRWYDRSRMHPRLITPAQPSTNNAGQTRSRLGSRADPQ